ncbi:ATP-dependent Clp protease [Cystobacter fuscus DSM 2262]|uniref:ATP-dependent Clp protease n=1 Tax=Cystobacter fuscus (strain ATCC 25194 / DSM 2262 / NBRC 100088 / M29) TaxID=1242864 RepID=S9Q3G3_CYSF2|nr:AAA family ATPase [Cystobacter fuscus]EPX55864.1 ATP-dependent Clp protease [Cystobacter fuscus DSM 2262]
MAPSDASSGTLEFTTPLLCQQLWNGDYQVFPVAAPALTSHASTLEACLSEQRLFLEEHLSRIEPEHLARFSFPERIRLEMMEIRAARADLPKRLATSTLVELAVVVVPLAAETWVFVPALDHTVFVGPAQDVRETVRADVERLLAARELSAPDFLRLLPPRSVMLETLALTLRREEAGDKALKARKKLEEKLQRDQAHEVLLSVSVPLHDREDARQGPPLLGRDTELALLSTLVGGEKRQGVLLVGPERVGKTELLQAWMRAERKAGRPRRVYATSGSRLIAGMSGFGQWQERVLRVMRAARELDAVLFFENLGELLAQHSTESVNIPGVMKPFLEEGRVRLLGELTSESLDLLENQHPGFFSLLARVRLEPLSAKQTREALRARAAWQRQAEPSRPQLAEDAVEPLVELAERYLPGGAMPGKAVRLYEELRASLHQARTGDGQVPLLTRERLYSLFSLKTGVPEFLLREDRALLAADVEASFRRQLVGQEVAVRRVVETLCMVKAGLQPQGKPLATFLFVGPTGVGKTELARLLATFLFGSPERMFRFDMSEFMDAWAAERLIRGSARGPGLLTRRVRQQPFCVLLLDEIEKAHPAVFDLLLQVCGEGRLTDTHGQTAWFHNALIIMTSNLGVTHRRTPLGIGAAPVDDTEHYLREVHRHFRPEFVNRIDQLIAFHPLTPTQVEQVARLTVDKLRQRRGLLQRGLELQVPPELLSSLAASGYHEAHGARALRRHLDQQLVVPLARALSAAGPEAQGGEVTLRSDSRGLSVALTPGSPRQARHQLERVESLQAERRELDAILRMDAVERLVEQVRFLVAQLAQGAHPNQGHEALSLGQLHHEHSRLDLLWAQVQRLRAALSAAEELALLALFEQQDISPFVEDAREQSRALRRMLPSVLLASQPQRDGITLIVQEAGETRALDAWLSPLLEELPRRGWVAGGRLSAVRHHKDDKRRWRDEVLSAEALMRALGEPERAFHEVLLSVSGPYAGSFLALEAGLHRFPPTPRDEPVLLTVQPVAMRPHLSQKELELPAIAPPAPVPLKELRLMPAVREHQPGGDVVLCDGARTVSLGARGYFQDWEHLLLEHLLHLERSGSFDPESTPSVVLDALRAATP